MYPAAANRLTTSSIDRKVLRSSVDWDNASSGSSGPRYRPPLGSAEQVVQVTVEAVLDDRADRLEGALLGVSRGAGVAENVVGDTVDVSGIAGDGFGILVETSSKLAQQ